jgi:hypothetical protein
MFATDDVFVGAIGQSPLRDVSHSFFYLVLIPDLNLNRSR